MAEDITKLSTIATAANAVSAGEPDGLLRLAALGDDLRRLTLGASRRAAEELLVSAVAALHPSRVIPISSHVEALLAALPSQRWGAGPVVLVDTLAASGTTIRRAAREVGGECKAVVLAAAADVEEAVGPLELVVALQELPST